MRSASRGKIGFSAWAIVVYAFLYLPILVMAIFAFNRPAPTALESFHGSNICTIPPDRIGNIAVWNGGTTCWFSAGLHDPDYIPAIVTSLQIAAEAAIIATVLGLCAALALARMRPRFRVPFGQRSRPMAREIKKASVFITRSSEPATIRGKLCVAQPCAELFREFTMRGSLEGIEFQRARSRSQRAFAPVRAELKAITVETDVESAPHRSDVPANHFAFPAAGEKISAIGTENRAAGLRFVLPQQMSFARARVH